MEQQFLRVQLFANLEPVSSAKRATMIEDGVQRRQPSEFVDDERCQDEVRARVAVHSCIAALIDIAKEHVAMLYGRLQSHQLISVRIDHFRRNLPVFARVEQRTGVTGETIEHVQPYQRHRPARRIAIG